MQDFFFLMLRNECGGFSSEARDGEVVKSSSDAKLRRVFSFPSDRSKTLAFCALLVTPNKNIFRVVLIFSQPRKFLKLTQDLI